MLTCAHKQIRHDGKKACSRTIRRLRLKQSKARKGPPRSERPKPPRHGRRDITKGVHMRLEIKTVKVPETKKEGKAVVVTSW